MRSSGQYPSECSAGTARSFEGIAGEDQLQPFISDFPNALDTEIAHGGANPGGQQIHMNMDPSWSSLEGGNHGITDH